jgi:hypothetical protein
MLCLDFGDKLSLLDRFGLHRRFVDGLCLFEVTYRSCFLVSIRHVVSIFNLSPPLSHSVLFSSFEW